MAKLSAGILVFRRKADRVELLLVHPGGPFWAKKDAGVWSLPKGEYAEDEDPLQAAKREFKEETGVDAPSGEYHPLGEVKYSNKKLRAWAVEGDADASAVKSNYFEMEWPPKSGQRQTFPEIDRAGWFVPSVAKTKLVKGQAELVDKLLEHLGLKSPGQSETDSQLSLF